MLLTLSVYHINIVYQDEQILGYDCRDNQEYLYIMCRRLKTCVDIHDEIVDKQ